MYYKLLLPIILAVNCFAQTTPAKDLQSMELLQKALNAGGGTVAGADFRATGIITYFALPRKTASVVLKGRGVDQFRLEAQGSTGNTSWNVNHGSGQYSAADGTITSMSYQDAMNAGMLILPLRRLALLTQDPAVGVQSLGIKNLNGQMLQGVRLVLSARISSGMAKAGLRKEFVDVYLSQDGGAIVAILDQTHPNGVARLSLPHAYWFSQYRRVDGVQVPFSILETMNNQLIWSLKLSTMQFNAGLRDQEFEF